MAITFDRVSSTTNDGSSTYSLTHTTSAAGTNRLMVVFTAEETADNWRKITSITYNGDPLTFLISRRMAGVNEGTIEMWYMLAPDTGANSVTVTWDTAPGTGSGVIVQTYNGVAQQAWEARSSNAAVAPDPYSQTINTVTAGAWAIGAVMGTSSSTSITSAGDQTERANITNTGAFRAASGDAAKAAPGTVTFTWDFSAVNDACSVIAAFASATNINKVNGISYSSASKVNGIAKASISKINGIT